MPVAKPRKGQGKRRPPPRPAKKNESRRRNDAPELCPVVGMGASAGGLEAFQKFFDAMPPDSGLAFVLVQHLDPRHDTLMPELLSKHTRMPVQQVRDETPVERDRVYVIPPGTSMELADGHLTLTPRPPRHVPHMPIDICSGRWPTFRRAARPGWSCRATAATGRSRCRP